MERKALKLALEALEEYADHEGKTRAADEAITAIQAALAQPAQEPVVDKGFPWTQKHVATPQVFGAMPSNIPPPQPAQEPVECLDCGSNNVGLPATYDSLINSVKALNT